MLSTYVIAAVITAIISLIVLRLISKNLSLVLCLSAVLVVLAIVMTHIYIINCPFPKPLTAHQANTFLSLVAQQAPNEFNVYQMKVDNNKKVAGSPDNEIYYITELVNSLLLKYGSQASNESLYHFLEQDIAFDKELYEINPQLVLFHQYPEKFEGKINPTDLQAIAKAEYQTKILANTENVIKSGMRQEHPKPSATDIQKAKIIFTSILSNLSKEYGQDDVFATLKDPADAKVDPKLTAKILIAFSEAILATGEETVGLLLRVSYSQTAVRQ